MRTHYPGRIAPSASTTTARASAGPLLDHLGRLVRSGGESALARLGLRPRHLVALTILRDHGGEIRQQRMAAALQIDGTNLVGLLNHLEAAGLVERRRSPEDRRRHVVELTGAGRRRLAQAEDALAALEDELLGALDDGERETLYRLLRKATGGQAGCAGQAAACAGDDAGC